MSQALLTHDFCWLTPDEMKTIDVHSIPLDGDMVMYKYPMELHDYPNDYPLSPESFQIKPEMLSLFQKDLLTKLEMKEGISTKLLPNLFDKEN